MEMRKYLNPEPGNKLKQFTLSEAEPIELVSTYKGLHFSQEVHICSISSNRVNICISQHPEWITASNIVTLDHANFITPLSAHVAEVNWRSGTAALTDLEESDHKWKLRSTDRIQPGEPLRIKVTAGRKTATVCLTNISLSGLGLIANHLVIHQLHLEPGAGITIEFYLPNQSTPLELKGMICRTGAIKNLLIYNIGISIRPTLKQAILLKRFIEMRRKAVFEEIKQSFTFGFEAIGTKDLYF
jgi:hypothetical protein